MSDEEPGDGRISCRYGTKCYQINSGHLHKYKHPSKKRNGEPIVEPAKKVKLNTYFQQELENLNHQENFEQKQEKKEFISASESDSENSEMERRCISEVHSDEETRSKNNQIFDPREYIFSKFLVKFSTDFYSFWDFCKKLNDTKPNEALKQVGLTLVGPFDVLANKFENAELSPDEYLLHWRYYYDPPELFTVLKGDANPGYHIGYFFDSPDELPSLLVSNNGNKDGVLTKMGDNIFAAVWTYLEDVKKTGNPFMKMNAGKLLQSLKTEAKDLNLSLSTNTQKIKDREKKIVAKTFNKMGLVVPYNKKTQLGYRDLIVTDKELLDLLNKLDRAPPEEKSKYLSDLQPVLTYANIALDECDFGTGIKLGWQLLYHGTDSLNLTISRFLSNSYKLLQRDAFAKIAQVHMNNRKKGSNLCILSSTFK